MDLPLAQMKIALKLQKTFMKYLTFLFLLLFSYGIFAETQILAPYREGKSNYVNLRSAKRSEQYYKGYAQDLLNRAALILESNLDQDLEAIVIDLESVVDIQRPSLRDRRNSLTHLLNLIRHANVIDDILYRLLLDSVEKKYPTQLEIENKNLNPGPAISLKDYLSKKKSIQHLFTILVKDKSVSFNLQDANPFPKDNFSFSVGKYRQLSAQERIFYLYSPSQIRSMGLIIDLALNISDAQSVITTVNFRDSSKSPLVIEHSATDQYRLAIRLMKAKKKEAERDAFQIGRQVTNLDLIVSSYLVGIINYEELSLIIHDPNFFMPEVSMEKKALKYVGGLALLGLKMHPVTAPYVIIPLILYNSYIENNKMKGTVDEDSFIFSLPGNK